MSTIKKTGELRQGKGCTISFYIDSSQSTDSIDHNWTEMTYDGLPDSKLPNVPLHWHKHHDEHMRVLKGRVEFFMDGKSHVRGPGDDVLVIPRRSVHGLRCFQGEAAVIQEKADPVAEGFRKEETFRDMFDGWTVTMGSAFRASWRGDAVLVMTGIGVVDEAILALAGRFFAWRSPGRQGG